MSASPTARCRCDDPWPDEQVQRFRELDRRGDAALAEEIRAGRRSRDRRPRPRSRAARPGWPLPTTRKIVTGPSTRSPYSSKRMSPRTPSSTVVRRSSSVTDDARAVGAGDRVEQDLRRLGGVRGGVRGARLACSRGFELLEEPLARGRELAVRHAVDAEVHPSCRRPRGLDQIRDGEEPIGGDERHVGTEAGAEIPNQGAAVRIEEAAEEDRVGVESERCAGRGARSSRASSLQLGGADDLEPEVPGRRFYVGTKVGVRVREYEQAPLRPAPRPAGRRPRPAGGRRPRCGRSSARPTGTDPRARRGASPGRAREPGPRVRGADHGQGPARGLVRNRDLRVRHSLSCASR